MDEHLQCHYSHWIPKSVPAPPFLGACSQLGFPKSSLFSRGIVLLALLFCSDFWDFMAARLPAIVSGHIRDPLSSSSVDFMSLGDRDYLFCCVRKSCPSTSASG